MTPIQALILGVVQGLTEFLPISSSGHLVLVEHLLNLEMSEIDMQGLNVILHVGTLLALLFCYARTWWRVLWAPFNGDVAQQRFLVLIIVATIPAALAGVFLEDLIAQWLQTTLSVGIAFAVTGIVLLLGERCTPKEKPHHSWWYCLFHRGKNNEETPIHPRGALIMGFAQALALVPGLSRSGLTISAGRAAGLTRSKALDFSFLMAVPIIAGASVLTLVDVVRGTIMLPTFTVILTGVLTSFGTSVIAILFLRRFVVRYSLGWFSLYLFAVSGVAIFVL